ncbi:MAG TPA: SDR family oxidoreductase [Kribbellaceae bacterium]|nr:SDR family oxidoreductase [Kribbellaceae bacterium]
MSSTGSVVVIGGTGGLGRAVAEHYAGQGTDVVLSGRDPDRAKSTAAEIAQQTGAPVRGIALDLARPPELEDALADVGQVRHLVLAAINRDHNTAAEYDVAQAIALVTLKLVGYTETIHLLLPRFTGNASIVVFGGQALNRPYPGSTTVSTVNGGVVGMVHSLAVELAPIRVNAVHPGIVGDSPYWSARPPEVLEAIRARTPIGRLASMQDIVGAVSFLLENQAVNGQSLAVDGGWLLM